MAEQPILQMDYSWLVVVLSSAAVVVAVSLFWALWRRNARMGAAVFVAFSVALCVGVIFQVRNTQVATVRREHARNQLEAIENKLRDMELQQEAQRQQRIEQATGTRLPDDSTAHQVASTDPVSSGGAPSEVSAAWLPEVDEQFEADVYPSAELASRALIREWLSHFDKLLEKGADKPEMVRIVCDSRRLDIDELELLEAMDEVVQKKFPEALTLVTTGPEAKENYEPKPGEIAIKLTVSQSVRTKFKLRSSSEPGRSPEISGVLLAAFKAPSWSFSFSTRFIEKPWLTATSEFLSLRHGTSYQVVRCSQLASSGEEATRDVLALAANRLGHLIDPRENQGLPRAASLIMLEQLEAGNYIADRFVQKLKRPYGDVYREAVLLDVGSSNLREMIQVAMSEAVQHQAATERRSAEQISGGLGLLVVLGALTGLYLLLNWLTKGYYRGPLTVIALLAGSGAILTVAMLVGLVT